MEYEEDGFHCIATWSSSAGMTNIERYDEKGECVGIETVSGKLFLFFSDMQIRQSVCILPLPAESKDTQVFIGGSKWN